MLRSLARTIILAALFNVVVLTSARSPNVPSFVPKAVVKETPVAHGKLQLNVPVSTTTPSVKALKGGFLPANEVKSTLALVVLDHLFRKAFQAKGIAFPSQLGGCCILFAFMIIAEIIKPGVGDGIFAFLSPGAGLLAKWLPVFFVPGLAMLPNAPSMGSPIEVSYDFFVMIMLMASGQNHAQAISYAKPLMGRSVVVVIFIVTCTQHPQHALFSFKFRSLRYC